MLPAWELSPWEGRIKSGGPHGIWQVTPRAPADSQRNQIRLQAASQGKYSRSPLTQNKQLPASHRPASTWPQGSQRDRKGKRQPATPHTGPWTTPTGDTAMPIFKHEPRRSPCDSAGKGLAGFARCLPTMSQCQPPLLTPTGLHGDPGHLVTGSPGPSEAALP